MIVQIMISMLGLGLDNLNLKKSLYVVKILFCQKPVGQIEKKKNLF